MSTPPLCSAGPGRGQRETVLQAPERRPRALSQVLSMVARCFRAVRARHGGGDGGGRGAARAPRGAGAGAGARGRALQPLGAGHQRAVSGGTAAVGGRGAAAAAQEGFIPVAPRCVPPGEQEASAVPQILSSGNPKAFLSGHRQLGARRTTYSRAVYLCR